MIINRYIYVCIYFRLKITLCAYYILIVDILVISVNHAVLCILTVFSYTSPMWSQLSEIQSETSLFTLTTTTVMKIVL